MYSLGWNQPGRRTGLSRDGYKAPRLLQTISSPNDREATMSPPKDVVSDEDIFAPPKDLSDTSSDDEGTRQLADIKPTQFVKRGSEEAAKPGGRNLRERGKSSAKQNATTATRHTRVSKQTSPEVSTRGLRSSNKRKGGDSVKFEAAVVDQFGHVKSKKAKKGKTYQSAHQQSILNLPQLKQLKESPEDKQFKTPATLDASSDLDSVTQTPKLKFKKLDRNEFDSPEAQVLSSPPGAAFKKLDTTEFDSPVKLLDDSPQNSAFRTIDTSGFESPTNSSPTKSVALKKVPRSSRRPPATSNTPEDEPAFTQLPTFKTFTMDEDLAERAQDIISSHTKFLDLPLTQIEEDDDEFTSRLDHCPMCKSPVDPEELKKYGNMNIRQQEKFCRDHQKRDAREEWSSKGYPEIDWDSLDARISQHYGFIKKLVNGADCHHRDMLNEKVKTGRDRTLLKSESSLTPGYYGTRGLQAISENLMGEFTPLLKKRVIKDRLMAARGVTGFVQSVLVPEVAVLLIKEDMNIAVDEAMSVLKESVNVGELVHEEIRDIVTRRIEDIDEGEEDSEYD